MFVWFTVRYFAFRPRIRARVLYSLLAFIFRSPPFAVAINDRIIIMMF